MVMLAKGNRSPRGARGLRANTAASTWARSAGRPRAWPSTPSRRSRCIEYPELGMEAIWRIEVEDFPAFIVIDDKGNDFYAGLIEKGRGAGPAGGGRLTGALAIAGALALGALPWLFPAEQHLTRAVATGFAISLALKLRLLVDRAANPEMLRTAPRVMLWLLVAPATHWPRTPAQARTVRRRAPGLLALAAALAAPLLPLALVKPAITVGSAGGWPAGTAVEMAQFYLLLAAMAEAVRGLCALGGLEADPVFRRPVLARTPAAFWGRRWNLVVHGFARRYVFLPVARRRGPALAVLATFAASGLMHEYLVLAAVGVPDYRPGFMLAFFVAQGVAVLAVAGAQRRGWPAAPAGLAVVLHLGWLLGTTPLFFTRCGRRSPPSTRPARPAGGRSARGSSRRYPPAREANEPPNALRRTTPPPDGTRDRHRCAGGRPGHRAMGRVGRQADGRPAPGARHRRRRAGAVTGGAGAAALPSSPTPKAPPASIASARRARPARTAS